MKPPLLILPDGNAINPLAVESIFAIHANTRHDVVVYPDRLRIEIRRGGLLSTHFIPMGSHFKACAERDRLIKRVDEAIAMVNEPQANLEDGARKVGGDDEHDERINLEAQNDRLKTEIHKWMDDIETYRRENERMKAELDAFEKLDIQPRHSGQWDVDCGKRYREAFPTRDDAVAARRKAAGLDDQTLEDTNR